MTRTNGKTPTILAEDILTALFEAQIAAEFYGSHTDHGPYMQRFIANMHAMQDASDALSSAMETAAGQPFRAIHSAPIEDGSPSVHDHLALVGLSLSSDVAEAMMEAWASETGESWPPEGEHECPPLPCQADFERYIDAALEAFRKHGPTHVQLNRWSAMLRQEVAVASTDTRENLSDWSSPATHRKWESRFGVPERTLRDWRAKGFRMKKAEGRRGMWRVHVKEPIYIEWDNNRTSLKD